tara:strand:+ start:934 stop:1458 length:525 start_codon:yes stop_codon:yes gene_type:complete
MNIHKSHTKGDLRLIFESLKVYINPELTKREIIETIMDYIDSVTYNNLISNKTKLQDIFRNPTTKKRLSIEEKTNIMHTAKKVIQYCNNHYYLNDIYTSHSQVYLDCLKIYRYGDIPTIRRALRLYNISPYKKDHINPIISIEVQELLKEKELIKKNKILKFKMSKGKYIIDFP